MTPVDWSEFGPALSAPDGDHPLLARMEAAADLTRALADAIDEVATAKTALMQAERDVARAAGEMSAAGLERHIKRETTDERIAVEVAEAKRKALKELANTAVTNVNGAQSYYRLVERQT